MRRGQSLVEATLVLLVFFALLLGVIDCGQILFAHQALVERVRSAVRWGAAASFRWDGRTDREPGPLRPASGAAEQTRAGFLGLTRANVQVRYQPATRGSPRRRNPDRRHRELRVAFLFAVDRQVLVSPRPVLVSAPVAFRREIDAGCTSVLNW